eukprot:3964236-Amphidinium_carterae.1
MNNIDDEEQTNDQKINTTENRCRCRPTQNTKMNLHDTKKQKYDFNDDVNNRYENDSTATAGDSYIATHSISSTASSGDYSKDT